MKNFLLLTACVLCLAAAVTAQKPKVDIAKKIADATPAELPQSPKDERLLSDAQIANLKGRVRSVAEYDVDGAKKTISKEEFYGEDGSLIRSVDYDRGYPRSVGVYGYIDGMRVSRFGDVAYSEGEKPASGGIDIFVKMDDNLKDPGAQKDTRYNMRYLYRFDPAGRLIEEQHLANTGEIWTRTTYTYTAPDRRLMQDFGNNGKDVWSRTMQIFDAQGNVLEEWLYDEHQKVAEIRAFTYTFDAAGNWTVRKSFGKIKVRGKQVLKPGWTSYRTITYF
jgi:hypothetical protein